MTLRTDCVLRTFVAQTSVGIVTTLAFSYGHAYRNIVKMYGLNIEITNIEIS